MIDCVEGVPAGGCAYQPDNLGRRFLVIAEPKAKAELRTAAGPQLSESVSGDRHTTRLTQQMLIF